MSVLRSMLYIPGNNLRMVTKSVNLTADAIILDLEDAVPMLDKATARIVVRDSIQPIKDSGSAVFVRVNALITGLTAVDVDGVTIQGLDGFMLSKSETAEDVLALVTLIEAAEKKAGLAPGSLTIIPLIESARGVMNAHAIAGSSPRVTALAFGAGDYYRDLGRAVTALSAGEDELLFARSMIVNAGRAAGVQAIDTPFLGLLTDKETFTNQTLRALRLGFKGKQTIHPMQIDLINESFSPSEAEVDYARRLVVAFEEAQKKGLGATSFEGKMIDLMSQKQALALVEFADTLAAKAKQREGASEIGLQRFFPHAG